MGGEQCVNGSRRGGRRGEYVGTRLIKSRTRGTSSRLPLSSDFFEGNLARTIRSPVLRSTEISGNENLAEMIRPRYIPPFIK